MKQENYDVVVVGAGSGGYAAARTARERGASIALIDHGPLGGLCILRGCMPSKTLLRSSELAQEVRESKELGIDAGDPKIDFRYIMERKKRIIKGFADYREEGIRTFPLYIGRARFLNESTIQVGDDARLRAKKFIIATGSVTAPPVIEGLAEAGYIDSDQALELEAAPKSLVVLGGGYVAAELGQFFYRIGVPTTFIQRSKNLLSTEDDDLGAALTRYFRAEGMRVETGTILQRIEMRDGLKIVHFKQDGIERVVQAHEIFYALGRVPNVDGLDLAKAGCEFHPISGITVDEHLRTCNPNFYAVGDVTGMFPLVHVAIYQGEVAARNATGTTLEAADYSIVGAHTMFTDPQVAAVGASEKQLQYERRPYEVASFPFDDLGKAIAVGRTKGFVKMIADPQDGRILGAALIGPDASDLIHEMIVAMHYRSTVFDFLKIPHLHPTLSEIWTYPAEELAERLGAKRAVAGSLA